MVITLGVVGLFMCPLALFLCDDLGTGFVFFCIGVVFWAMLIASFKQDKKKKSIKSPSRKRNEDDFLNDYGHIDNSAFGSIQSFINDDTHK